MKNVKMFDDKTRIRDYKSRSKKGQDIYWKLRDKLKAQRTSNSHPNLLSSGGSLPDEPEAALKK